MVRNQIIDTPDCDLVADGQGDRMGHVTDVDAAQGAVSKCHRQDEWHGCHSAQHSRSTIGHSGQDQPRPQDDPVKIHALKDRVRLMLLAHEGGLRVFHPGSRDMDQAELHVLAGAEQRIHGIDLKRPGPVCRTVLKGA